MNYLLFKIKRKMMFSEGLGLGVENCYFKAMVVKNKQTFGGTDGWMLVSQFCGIFMDYILNRTFKEIGIQQKLCAIYFVDTLIINISEVQKIFEVINRMHTRIKFTVEYESNGKIRFFDMFLVWDDRKVITL